MIGGIFLFLIALIASVGVVSVLIYRQQETGFLKLGIQQQMLAQLDSSIRELAVAQLQTQKRLDQVSKDILQRDIYKSADERHHQAIQSARQGQNVIELTQRYGLSPDEAALIISMHSNTAAAKPPSSVENANLTDPTVVELI